MKPEKRRGMKGIKIRIIFAGFAVFTAVCAIAAMISLKSDASNIWPQKSTAPFYCLDGGKSWNQSDRYAIYKYNTLPNPVSSTQAKRLFWGYPDNWNALKKAVSGSKNEKVRAALSPILGTDSGPNTVKYIKDDPNTMFAWVADNPEIEQCAIDALIEASESGSGGKIAPDAIKDATSETSAVVITVPPFSAGPGALETSLPLTQEFVRDIAKIEPQSVYDNGSGGGNAGWIDASQDKNIAKSVLGENLYEFSWSGDSIKIRNNGSAAANENAVGSTMSEEGKYNKTDVIYKITMRSKAGWVTSGEWDDDYLCNWMDFKACTNAPGHQRLYEAHIQITPSDQVFYIRVNQTGDGADSADRPEYGVSTPELNFNIYRHEETFDTHYNVRLEKYDDETGMPLKGSQFYLCEKFEDAAMIGDSERDGGLVKENLSFGLWDGFEIFAEQTTDDKGIVTYTDERSYKYSKTYCDGHPLPVWADIEDEDPGDDRSPDDDENDEAGELMRDRNRAAASAWLELVGDCGRETHGGKHFHWLLDEDSVQLVEGVLDSGLPRSGTRSYDDDERDSSSGSQMGSAFERSGCKSDCEKTYENFCSLKFTYTWKEVQARPGYILHGLHSDDVPVEFVTTTSSESGAVSSAASYTQSDISGAGWYCGNGEPQRKAAAADRAPVMRKYDGNEAGDADKDAAVQRGSSAVIKRIAVETPYDAARPEQKGPAVSYEISFGNPGEPFISESSSDAYRAARDESASDAVRGNLLPVLSDTGGGSTAGSFKRLLSGYREIEMDDGNWEIAGNFSDFSSTLKKAKNDGIKHLSAGDPGNYSHYNGSSSWKVCDHRTEGQIHINKRDLDLYKYESDTFDSYGGTEGDNTLEGAVYGLFAANDIIHPDSEISPEGEFTNTGIVYKKNDLVAQAVTDTDGNADFLVYTRAPGETYDYKTGKTVKRTDISWDGPSNLYDDNESHNGNYWIGRPLILGDYYVKELSRSEGFELSVNGMKSEVTNAGTGFETPEAALSSRGTVTVSTSQMNADMAGYDGDGEGGPVKGVGYDEFLFTAVSSGTGGYEIIMTGIPMPAEAVRIDTVIEDVTRPHITGTEEKIVTDETGKTVWVTAESDTSDLRYKPEKDNGGNIIGQTPCMCIKPQTIIAEQIPEKKPMALRFFDFDIDEGIFAVPVKDLDLSDEQAEPFGYLKATLEEILAGNGYAVPANFEGKVSTVEKPVYSRGVKRGEPDIYEMTTGGENPAVKTVYGAATADLSIKDESGEITLEDILSEILSWYRDNPQWDFGGIDRIGVKDADDRKGKEYLITLYAGVSDTESRIFFTMKADENGKADADKVYSVVEDDENKKWFYQEYLPEGEVRYEVTSRYYLESNGIRRYYIDAVLTPAVYIENGEPAVLRHEVMQYFKEGEPIKDYILGDPENGYQVPLTETVYKIEDRTESEEVEKEIPLEFNADGQGRIRIQVPFKGKDGSERELSDSESSLTLQFCVRFSVTEPVVLTKEDIDSLGAANVWGYREGDEIGYAQYLLRFKGVTVTASTADTGGDNGSYIVTSSLPYRGQQFVTEDAGSGDFPLQILERPIKQKVTPVKKIENGAGIVPGDPEVLTNFRFKIYLKSNLERLFADEDGVIIFTDKYGEPLNIEKHPALFPEFVPKIYTKETKRPLLETVDRKFEDGTDGYRTVATYNYEKFFDAVAAADKDRRKNKENIRNTSFKPFVSGLYGGIENEINTSKEARENALRSDAVRQFAVDWYLKEEIEKLTVNAPDGAGSAAAGDISYTDELYDKALYLAILRAEEYLAPFYAYDIGSICEIAWDSEPGGGCDGDKATLSADLIGYDESGAAFAYGISSYLPYGEYVIVEQQPYSAEYGDFPNRHYKTDTPKEISLPSVYGSAGTVAHPEYSPEYIYNAKDTPSKLAERYLIRFNEERAENAEEPGREYVIKAQNNDGGFEVYPYGLDKDQTGGHYEPYLNPDVAKYYHYRSDSEDASVEDNVIFTGGETSDENRGGIYFKDNVSAMTGMLTAYDGKYAAMLVPWSVKASDGISGTDSVLYGCAREAFFDRVYYTDIRIEKLDSETGEPILHDDAVFALCRAERDESRYGEGEVKRYGKDTVIYGSREFLTAMGAYDIEPVKRNILSLLSGKAAGPYKGTVPAGTFICSEKDCMIFSDDKGEQRGTFKALSTVFDGEAPEPLQTAGYLVTPEAVPAGAYVLAELKTPAGYVRSSPVAVEIYSDSVKYYKDDAGEKAAAVIFPYGKDQEGNKPENIVDTARIYINDTATSVEVSKLKPADTIRRMEISGRVEGTRIELAGLYGSENLEFAFNSSGTYMGFGWIKGTAEYLENRKNAGESVEPVYDKGVFQGYGYITKTLDSADHAVQFVKGAGFTLFDAVSVKESGDTGDHAFEGVEVTRDKYGNVTDISVKEGYAGERTEFLYDKEENSWYVRTIERKDTPVLFFELNGLDVTRTDGSGLIYGYDRTGRPIRITYATPSIYALKGGVPLFEITGGDLSRVVYDANEKAFLAKDPETRIYRLDEDLNRTALVDGYTGLAYVEYQGPNDTGEPEDRFYLWPVTISRDRYGNVLSRDKIVTGRPAEINAGTKDAYITGTYNEESGRFEKIMYPVYDEFGMIRYYTKGGALYTKGTAVYDRDGDYIRYRYDDLLEDYNRAAYTITDHGRLFDNGDGKDDTSIPEDARLYHRYGEAFIIPNIFISGDGTPNDPADSDLTPGQADLLRRVYPGEYIIEETLVPDGYIVPLPAAFSVAESTGKQCIPITNEATKVEISKIDAPASHKVPLDIDGVRQERLFIEGSAGYGYKELPGVSLALYKARRVATTDPAYPEGYRFVKEESTPFAWNVDNPVDNTPAAVNGMWITGERPRYFEGIPAGDFILEETDVPPGIIPASVWITIEDEADLQSFLIKNDHTKLEIEKYISEDGIKSTLPYPGTAVLSLYAAVTGDDGEPACENGEYVIREEDLIDSWEAYDRSPYFYGFKREYEKLFDLYGDGFDTIRWTADYDTDQYETGAVLVSNVSTPEGENVRQIWETDDGRIIDVTVTRHDGAAAQGFSSLSDTTFEYRFDFKEGVCEKWPDIVSYDTLYGVHRFDRIPEGSYILVETETPEGYESAPPKLITVKRTEAVQRYEIENVKIFEEMPAGPEEEPESEPEPEPAPKPDPPYKPEPGTPVPSFPHAETITVISAAELTEAYGLKTGLINTRYDTVLDGSGIFVIPPKGALHFSFPKTGDDRRPEVYIFGMLMCAVILAALLCLKKSCGRKDGQVS